MAKKSRVHITFDVNDKGAMRKVELPYIVGVVGDFSMKTQEEREDLASRKFNRISSENFDDTMADLKPTLRNIKVDNVLDPESEELLTIEKIPFNSMKSFSPAEVAKHVPEIRALLEKRNQLKELSTHADFSPEIKKMLGELLQDTEALKEASQKLGPKSESSGEEVSTEGDD
ncbi:MAG: type VI secretion system contractile sheath small subunit [Planctomycetota bacterium]